MKSHKKKKKNSILLIMLIVLFISVASAAGFAYYLYKEGNKTSTYYLANDTNTVPVLNSDLEEEMFVRGVQVNIKNRTKTIENIEYRIFDENGVTYYIEDKYCPCTQHLYISIDTFCLHH